MKLWELVELTWVDSNSEEGWISPHDIDRKPHTMLCKTVGYYFRDKGDAIQVVQSVSWQDTPDEQVGAVMTIPKVAIKRTRRLK